MPDSRHLTAVDLTFLGVGSIIGSGIFALVGIGIDMVGKAVSLALVVGALVNLVMCIPLLLTTSVTHVSGGIYGVARVLLGPYWGGLFGVLQVFSSAILAIYAIAIAQYLAELWPPVQNHQKVVACCVLLFFFALTLLGTKSLARFQGVMVVVMLASLALFVWSGLPDLQPGHFGQDYLAADLVSLAMAVAVLSFASSGSSMLVNFYEVTDNPRRNFPLALFASTGIVCLVYFLIGVVASGVLPLEVVANQTLGVVARAVMSDGLYLLFIGGGALLALASTLNNLVAMIRYPALALAEDGHLPQIMKRTDKRGYPWPIMITFLGIGLAPIILNLKIDEIVSVVFGPSYLLATVFALSVIRLPQRYPEAWHVSPFKMPGWLLVVVGTVVAATFTITGLLLVANLSPMLRLVSLGVGIFGIAYVVRQHRRNSGLPAGQDVGGNKG